MVKLKKMLVFQHYKGSISYKSPCTYNSTKFTIVSYPCRSGAWQSTLSGAEGGREGRSAVRGPQLVIPRAKVKPRSNYQAGYNSDDDRMSAAEVSNFRELI